MNFVLEKKRKISCLLVLILFLTATLIPLFNTPSVAAETGIVRILEIQPTTSSDITGTMKTKLRTHFGQNVEVTQMPMPLFISKAEEVNGFYDIVYIGNNTAISDPYNSYYKGNIYSRFGPKVNNNCNYASAVSGNKEFYNGNDISDIAAEKIKSFIESGQLTVFDSGVFTDNKTKLYENFYGYRNDNINVVVGNTSNLLDNLKKYKNTEIKKRPSLELTQKPVEYDGTNITVNNGLINFALNLKNSNSTDSMSVMLYIDRNGDGVFKSNEIAQTYDGVTDSDNYSINYIIPSKYTGLVPWKLEVTDGFGAKAYETGFTAYKGQEQRIRVLQLLPDNNDNYATLKLSSLYNYNGQNLLYKAGEYNIIVTEMKISTFNSNYGSNVVGKPTILNGNYDMVIFGFDDAYKGDLTGTALSDMEAFADSGQAIMFTHDTVGFTNTNLTREFKDRLGMNAVAGANEKPANITVSTGMTRLALLNANGDSRFPDTILTKKINESNLTKYPFILGDITVSPTHLQYIRLNPEDPDIVTAFTYKNEYKYQHGTRTATLIRPTTAEDKYHEYDGFNDYYTYFKGNLTFSGTGHSPITSIEELKMFVNTMLKASVGSNHAPSVEIIGLSDGQDIANTLDTLNFSLLAGDPDIDDRRLKGKVYIDNDGDGIYEAGEDIKNFIGTDSLENGIAREVSMAKNVNNNVTRFNIKAVVTDPSGAEGSAEISINHKDVPVLNLSHNRLNGLVGDQLNEEITVSAKATNLRKNYQDLVLSLPMDKTAFSQITAIGGGSVDSSGKFTKSLSPVNFTPSPDIETQSGAIRFKAIKAGTFSTTANLSYKDGYYTKAVTDPLSIDVRSGSVSAVVKDNLDHAINGLEVKLKRYNKNADGGYSPDSGFGDITAVTDGSGVASFSNVPTGYYGAAIVMPDGYGAIDNSNTGKTLTKIGDAQLNYENNLLVIKLPALYKIPVITITGHSMAIWSKQTLSAAVTPKDLYDGWKVTWQVEPVTGAASIDPVTGVLTAKKLGMVKITATAENKDPGGNIITGTLIIDIGKGSVDIN